MREHRVGYTVAEAAALVGLPRTTIYDVIQRGELRTTQVGRRIVIPTGALEEMLGSPIPERGLPDVDPDEGINHVELAGRLMATPELRVSRRGLNYCTLRVAIGHPGDSDTVEIDLVAFGRRAEIAAGLSVDQAVRVEGRFTQRHWQGKDGVERKSHRVVADRIRALPAEAPGTVAS